MLKHSLSKEQRYQELVEKFKKFRFIDTEIWNPYQIEEVPYFYTNHLNPWNIWHGNLDADIMLIGQDFGSISYFKELYETNWKGEINNPTNKTLGELFGILDYNIGVPNPNSQKNDRLYFVNSVLGLKEGAMDAPIKKDEWYKCTANDYLLKVIEIINPKYIISMGEKAYKTICFIKGEEPSKFLEYIEGNKSKSIKLLETNIFIVAHCGSKGQLNRSFDKQKEDWLKIKEYIEKENQS